MSKIPGLSGRLAEEHHQPKLISGGSPTDSGTVEGSRFSGVKEGFRFGDGASMVGAEEALPVVGNTAKLTTVE